MLDGQDLHIDVVPLVEPGCKDRQVQHNLDDLLQPLYHQQRSSPVIMETSLKVDLYLFYVKPKSGL